MKMSTFHREQYELATYARFFYFIFLNNMYVLTEVM